MPTGPECTGTKQPNSPALAPSPTKPTAHTTLLRARVFVVQGTSGGRPSRTSTKDGSPPPTLGAPVQRKPKRVITTRSAGPISRGTKTLSLPCIGRLGRNNNSAGHTALLDAGGRPSGAQLCGAGVPRSTQEKTTRSRTPMSTGCMKAVLTCEPARDDEKKTERKQKNDGALRP